MRHDRSHSATDDQWMVEQTSMGHAKLPVAAIDGGYEPLMGRSQGRLVGVPLTIHRPPMTFHDNTSRSIGRPFRPKGCPMGWGGSMGRCGPAIGSINTSAQIPMCDIITPTKLPAPFRPSVPPR